MEAKSTVRVAGVVRGNGGCILLEQNAVSLWHLPETGREKGERLAQALCRHIKDRYGLECDVREGEPHLVYETLSGKNEHALVICFTADARSTDLRANLGNLRWALEAEVADYLKRGRLTNTARELLCRTPGALKPTGT